MPEIFVGAGSNADPERALRRAAARARAAVRRAALLERLSQRGRRRPRRADYLNLVACSLSTERDVDSVRAALRAIEAHAGRSRVDPAVCELDLDLLLYGARVDADRRLPRPGLFTAPFVLGPLAELAPELVHPVTGERCRAAWRARRAATCTTSARSRALGVSARYQPTLRPPSTAMIWPVT